MFVVHTSNCHSQNCTRRAIFRLGIDTLIVNVLVVTMLYLLRRTKTIMVTMRRGHLQPEHNVFSFQ